jgi:hypothetical protein
VFTVGGNGNSAEELEVASRLGNPRMLERVVAELQELQRRGGIERTLAIGDLILHQFFGGDATAWHDRRRNKNNSIRRLAGRKDCPFSRSALNEAVAVYVASLTLPCVRTFGHIGASHVVAVLGLSAQEREDMLGQAERDRMSVRELRHKVVSMRRAHGERRGRPGGDGSARTLALFRKAVGDIMDGVHRLGTQARLSPAAREEVRELLVELNRVLAEAGDLTRDLSSVVRSWPLADLSREQSA